MSINIPTKTKGSFLFKSQGAGGNHGGSSILFSRKKGVTNKEMKFSVKGVHNLSAIQF